MNTPSIRKSGRGTRARSIARKAAMQALYQWQMTQQSAAEIEQQHLESDDSPGLEIDYFHAVLAGCIDQNESINAVLTPFIDRPLNQLDPVEAAILMIGIYELRERLEVPYRVVINEGVDLCKRFGATDAHKYINAVLDRAARELRSTETQ